MPHDMSANTVLELISSRRSVAPKRLGEPGPTSAEIATMVRTAMTAPDHGALRPWRVIHVADSSRDRLAEVFVEAKRRRLPDAPQSLLDRERNKALNAATLLVVCARVRSDVAEVPVHEQLVAVGAAVQNMLLAAHALGFAAILLSGEKARDPFVRAALDLSPDEILIGFLSIGSVSSPLPPPKQRPAVDDHLSLWTGPAVTLRSQP
jgi:nitroreductase